jgi:hypothetical protein
VEKRKEATRRGTLAGTLGWAVGSGYCWIAPGMKKMGQWERSIDGPEGEGNPGKGFRVFF